MQLTFQKLHVPYEQLRTITDHTGTKTAQLDICQETKKNATIIARVLIGYCCAVHSLNIPWRAADSDSAHGTFWRTFRSDTSPYPCPFLQRSHHPDSTPGTRSSTNSAKDKAQRYQQRPSAGRNTAPRAKGNIIGRGTDRTRQNRTQSVAWTIEAKNTRGGMAAKTPQQLQYTSRDSHRGLRF